MTAINQLLSLDKPAAAAVKPARKAATEGAEAVLARTVAADLEMQGWDCYYEVSLQRAFPDLDLNGICDIVAVQGRLAMAVECKTSLSLDLMEQAIEWTRVFPLVAIAVPAAKLSRKRALRDHLADFFRLGQGEVSEFGVAWTRRARLHRPNIDRVPAIRSALSPMQKLAIPGAQVNANRETPYQRTITEVRIHLAQHGPMPIRELVAHLKAAGGHHYASDAGVGPGILSAIRTIEPDLIISQGRVGWLPGKCARGDAYIAQVRDTAIRRAQLNRVGR